MFDPYQIIEKYYTPHTEVYYILVKHSEQVRDKALEIARKHPEMKLNTEFIAEAALLHDIGIFLCDAPRIFCHGNHAYIEHGYLSADLLRKEGLPQHALVCERHTGTGISLEKILEHNLPLPHRDMQPITLEEQVICYADKFFSKTELHTMHSLDRIRTSIGRHGAEHVAIFDAWHKLFS
ncbi:MAG: HDIG domain-containing protein [Paludibacter sp.]|nr:HDIG domain-containing protein [Paludibacter sp.]